MHPEYLVPGSLIRAGTTCRNRYDASGDHMLSVWSEPGVAGKTYAMPWGETAGEMLLGFVLLEQVTHSWDIAKATGRPLEVEEDVVATSLQLAQEYDNEAIRVPGMFDPILVIDEGASTIDWLAAFLGRDTEKW